MKVKFLKLHPDAVMPKYAKPGDAGLDIIAVDDGINNLPKDGYYYREYSTGLAVEIPPGHVGLLFPRSSVSSTALSLANAVGVIDSGYRGEIKFRFRYDAQLHLLKPLGFEFKYKLYKKGDKIGQLVIMPYPTIEPEEASSLNDSERGSGGFGSTGA